MTAVRSLGGDIKDKARMIVGFYGVTPEMREECVAELLALFTTELEKSERVARTDEAVKALDVAINHQMDSTYDIILVLAAHAKDLEALSAGDGKTGTSLH